MEHTFFAHLVQTVGWVGLVLIVSMFLVGVWALVKTACVWADARLLAARQRVLDEARRRLVLDAALRLPLRHIRPRPPSLPAIALIVALSTPLAAQSPSSSHGSQRWVGVAGLAAGAVVLRYGVSYPVWTACRSPKDDPARPVCSGSARWPWMSLGVGMMAAGIIRLLR